MSTVMKKSFDNPVELRAPDKAKVSVCDLGGITAAKLVLQPGWSSVSYTHLRAHETN